MFDAYTVKKVVPRLLIAAILIQLSWPLFTYMIYIVGQISWGIEGLLYAPFGGSQALELKNILSATGGSAPGTAAVLTFGGIGVGVVALTLGGTLLMALSILLALIIAFFVLAARQVLIVILLVTAPLALVAWILPNTEKMWKIWWESFSKVLFMYPLILLLIAGGKITARIISELESVDLGNGGFQIALIFIAFFGPYFLIPATFKVAGSAFANITGMMNDKSRGVFDRLRNARGEAAKRGWEDKKSGNWFRGGTDSNFRGRLNKGMSGATHVGKAGFNPRNWKENIGTAMTTTAMQDVAKAMEDPENAPWKGDDTLNKIANEWITNGGKGGMEGFKQALIRGGYDGDVGAAASYVMRASRTMGTPAFAQFTLLNGIAGGTAYDDVGAWEAAAKTAGGNRAVEASLVAQGRSMAMGAGRVDQGGAGFGATLGTVHALRENRDNFDSGNISAQEYQRRREEISLEHTGNVIESQGPGSLVHPNAKPTSVENMIPAMRKRLEDAIASGDQDRIDRELAVTQSLHDELSRTAPNKARIVADQLLRWKPGGSASQQTLSIDGTEGPVAEGGGPTIQELSDARRGTAVWQTTHKEFQDSASFQARGEQVVRDNRPENPGGGPIGGGPIGGGPIGGGPI